MLRLAALLLLPVGFSLNTSCCFGCCKTSELKTIGNCKCSTFENTALAGTGGTGSPLSTTFTEPMLQEGKKRTYHWELKDYSLVNHDTDAYITFDLSSCDGEADLDLNLGDMLSHDFLPTYNVTSTGAGTSSMVRVKLRYGEFYATVTARTNVTYTFTISAAVSSITNGPNVEIMHSHANYSKDNSSVIPSPGAGGMMTVKQTDTTSILACFVGVAQSNVTYDLYFYEEKFPLIKTVDGAAVCMAACCESPGSCGMATPCGMAANERVNKATLVRLHDGDIDSKGMVVGPSSVICQSVKGLKSSGTYIFNVAARAPYGYGDTAYAGVTATLKYTIIAAAHDEIIIVYVLSGVAGVFLVLIGLIVAGKIFMECYIRKQKNKKVVRETKGDDDADAAVVGAKGDVATAKEGEQASSGGAAAAAAPAATPAAAGGGTGGASASGARAE